ncbi:plasmid replication protein RepC [Mameliella sp.]|uniref:plasmid replication protein RepC n=1 Tax=Mameliella sp. TaxID=1924940 RepID=UPI003B505B9F
MKPGGKSLPRENLMERVTLTPFGRGPVSAGQLLEALDRTATDQTPVPKWQVFRNLTTARHAYGLSDRDLVVLNAMLTFLPSDELDPDNGLIVFPSNATLSSRAHGMPESTLRRHVAKLVQSGVIRRHDSPNGKRYARRDRSGTIRRAFGFDLSPLLAKAQEIAEAAREAEDAAEQLKLLRETCVLMVRDVAGLSALVRTEGDEIADRLILAQRVLRRKPQRDVLMKLCQELGELKAQLQQHLPHEEPIEDQKTTEQTEEVSGTDPENERHQYSSKKDTDITERPVAAKPVGPALSLDLIADACPEIEVYEPEVFRSWNGLTRAAQLAAKMMGISTETWAEACESMGPEQAATTVACILQRFDRIRSPGAYLRHLSMKARAHLFTPLPMVLALLTAVNQRDAKAA